MKLICKFKYRSSAVELIRLRILFDSNVHMSLIERIPRKTLAYLSLIFGIMALSLSALFVRWSEAPGTVTTFYRMTVAGVVLLPFFLRLPAADRAPLRFAWYLPLLGGLCTAFDHGLWSTSIGLTRIANATLMNNLSPLWVALFAWLVFREKLTNKFWVGLIVTLLGTIVFFGGQAMQEFQISGGDLLAIASSLFYAFYFLVTQRSRQHLRTLAYIVPVNWVCAISLLVFNLANHYSLTGYSPTTWLTFLGAGLISQVIGYSFVGFALGSLPASLVAPSTIASPVLTSLLAIPLAGEMLQVNQWVGGLILLFGIYLVNRAHRTA
jgi:drug/metabolite transporter (DMT)-like permease